MEIINALNDLIRKGAPDGRRMTQARISEKTGIGREHLSRMLAGKRTMSLEHACLIAEVIGARITVEGFEETKKPDEKSESHTYEAFRAAVENSKMLQEHIKWLEEQFNDLKRNSILITNPRNKNLG